MAVILTRKGEEILVDDADFEMLNQYTWRIHQRGYVVTNLSRKLGHKEVKMHRLITECPKGKIVDHADRNKLNNQRNNLRITTNQMNTANSKPQGDRKYKGVYDHYTKWKSVIGFEGKNIWLGSFNTPEEAALAYNQKALELFGEFAKLNEIEGGN